MREALDRFLSVAVTHADKLCIAHGARSLTYREFEALVRRYAGIFAGRPNSGVLIALAPCADSYAAMLGAGLAGCYYVPVSETAPLVRKRYVKSSVAPAFVLAPAADLDMLADPDADETLLSPDALPLCPPLEGAGVRHEIAYIIFTSGSTGAPKGVVIARPALDHYVGWIEADIAPVPDDRISQYANIAFDLSVLEIYAALCFGASLHPVGGQGDRLMPAQMIKRERLTIWISVPSVVSLMIRSGQIKAARLASLRRLVFCGEPLRDFQVEALFAACPDVVVQNTYGPTEATVSMTTLPMTASSYRDFCRGTVALGDAIPGMAIDLLGGPDENEGELVLSGPQLALGYWKDPDRSALAFREVDIRGALRRAYFTGDWAKRSAEGLFFKERVDFQVKVRGFRIELEDVASALVACGYADVCVFKHDEMLVAVVEAADPVDEDAVRTALRRRLDTYAIPDTITSLQRLFRNDNDKIDRKAVIAWFSALPTGDLV